jgi:MFS family permease
MRDASAVVRILPISASPDAVLILAARGSRAVADGCVSVVLPAYLLLLGFDAVAVGLLTTATLLGSAILTLLVGFAGGSFALRTLLVAASLLMAATGLGFATVEAFWPLLVIAFVGTLNPSAGDVSVFLPLEHAVLSKTVADRDRTALFARYSMVGTLCGALGTLLAALPDTLFGAAAPQRLAVFQTIFLLYGVIGAVAGLIYRRLAVAAPAAGAAPPVPLGPSRGIVLRLAALFSVDAFAGGLVVQSLLALWLFDTYAFSVAGTAQLFFWMQIFASISFLLAVRIAARIGLIATMVFTHLPANLCLIALPFAQDLWLVVALLLARGLLSQMDVPTRTSYVMAVVTPPERPAAASLTAVPRSLASALGPSLGGYLLAISGFGWPFVAAGVLKTVYDLALLALFRNVRPPEEGAAAPPAGQVPKT